MQKKGDEIENFAAFFNAKNHKKAFFGAWKQHSQQSQYLRKMEERGLSFDLQAGLAQSPDTDNSAVRDLLIDLSRYPEVVEVAGRDLEPHLIAAYLVELAQAYQTYYNGHQFLVDDAATRNARLALGTAVRQVLANGLGLLGVSAPEEMFFDDTGADTTAADAAEAV